MTEEIDMIPIQESRELDIPSGIDVECYELWKELLESQADVCVEWYNTVIR